MKGLVEFIEGAATSLLVVLGIAAMLSGTVFLLGLWRSHDEAKLQKIIDTHIEQIRLNNELMIQESVACARSGGVPVRVDIMHAPPHIHCAR